MKTIQLLITSIFALVLSYQNALSQTSITVSKQADNTAKLVDQNNSPVDLKKVELTNGLFFTYDGYPKPSELIAQVIHNNDETSNPDPIKPKEGTDTFELTAAQHLSNVKSLELWFKFGNDKWPEDGITLQNTKPEQSENELTESGSKNALKPEQIIFPFTSFESDDIEKGKRSRVLILDGNANPRSKINATLYKRNEKDELVTRKSIPNNGSISVITRHNSLRGFSAVSVNINETNYAYSKGINDILDGIKKEDIEDKKKQDVDGDIHANRTPNIEYIEKVLDQLKKIKYISFSDLALIRKYQNELKASYEKNASDYNDIIENIGKIIAWNPDYVELTTLPIVAEDADEIEITVGLTRDGESKENTYRVGNYKTSGGIAFHVNSSIFLTNLVDRDVFTEEIPVADSEGEVQRFARLDDSDSPLNLGVGANGELSFRTGSLFRPTINIGVFVPFEQDLSPIFASGVGFSIAGETVRLGISGGLAFGQVNEIKSEYRDKDLSSFSNLTNDNLAKKVWKQGCQVAVGLSFNIN